MTSLVPLQREPELVVVNRPPLSTELERETERISQELKQGAYPGDATAYDGPLTLAGQASAERIEICAGRYSQTKLELEEGEAERLVLRKLLVGLMIVDGERQLWGQRSALVARPHDWGFAAAGHVDSADLAQSLYAEAEEELSLSADDFAELGPLALYENERGVHVLYLGRLKEGVEPTANPTEVIELRWVEDPLRQLSPLMPSNREMSELLREQGLL